MKIKKNIALSESGFVFDPSSGDSFSTNPVGLQIIKLLKEGKELEEIKKELLNQYLTDATTLDKDIYDFANMLVKFNVAEEGKKA